MSEPHYPAGTDPKPEREAEMLPNDEVVPDAGKVSTQWRFVFNGQPRGIRQRRGG